MREHTELYFVFMRSSIDLCHQKPPRYCAVRLAETVVLQSRIGLEATLARSAWLRIMARGRNRALKSTERSRNIRGFSHRPHVSRMNLRFIIHSHERLCFWNLFRCLDLSWTTLMPTKSCGKGDGPSPARLTPFRPSARLLTSTFPWQVYGRKWRP
jgi:hypothetical protein